MYNKGFLKLYTKLAVFTDYLHMARSKFTFHFERLQRLQLKKHEEKTTENR